MAQARHGASSEAARLSDRVEKVVQRSVDRVEEIHKKVAGLPLDVLEQLEVLEGAVRDIRKLQDRSIGAVYGAVRDINHEVTRLAKGLLVPARSKARPRKKTTKGARAVKGPVAA